MSCLATFSISVSSNCSLFLIFEVQRHCNYTNTKESRKPGIFTRLHCVLHSFYSLSFSSHHYTLLHFILINLTYKNCNNSEKSLCSKSLSSHMHCDRWTDCGNSRKDFEGQKKWNAWNKILLFTFSWKLFCKFWGIFIYFQGSLNVVCKYQPHKTNKCGLFKAVSPALLISAWLRNFAFCFCMSPDGEMRSILLLFQYDSHPPMKKT